MNVWKFIKLLYFKEDCGLEPILAFKKTTFWFHFTSLFHSFTLFALTSETSSFLMVRRVSSCSTSKWCNYSSLGAQTFVVTLRADQSSSTECPAACHSSFPYHISPFWRFDNARIPSIKLAASTWRLQSIHDPCRVQRILWRPTVWEGRVGC